MIYCYKGKPEQGAQHLGGDGVHTQGEQGGENNSHRRKQERKSRGLRLFDNINTNIYKGQEALQIFLLTFSNSLPTFYFLAAPPGKQSILAP